MRIRKNDIIRESIYEEQLDCGLTVAVLPMKGWARSTATFGTRFGGMDSALRMPDGAAAETVPDGIAHFLEHLLFESEQGNVSDVFARLGASSNAYTNPISTVYYYSTSLDFWEPFDVLLDFVQEPYFTPENVNKEQGIIEQEIRMGDDNPATRVYYNFVESMYRVHPARKRVIGDVPSIRRITPELLLRCHNAFYHPSNMHVFVAGDLDPEAVIERVRRNVDRRGYTRAERVERSFPEEPPEVARPRVTQAMDVSRPIIRLGFKDRTPPGEETLRREILLRIALDAAIGPASSLYRRLYDDGIIDESFFATYAAQQDHAFSYIGGMAADAESFSSRVTEGLFRLAEEGLPDEDIRRIRKKYLGGVVAAFQGSDQVAYLYNSFQFRDLDVFDYPDGLAAVTAEAVNSAFREHIRPEQLVISEVVPARKGA